MFSSALHGLLLTLINIFAILGGFAVYKLSQAGDQLIIQLPAALFLTLIVFPLGEKMAGILPFHSLQLTGKRPYLKVYFLALIWTPLVFIPLHYLTQGYLTSFGNILAIWQFQLIVNLVVIILTLWILKVKPNAAQNH
jgi:hypothetical protein